jgi:ubiquinone/menaquinone biosynthesis C-methylase UbiE
MHDHKDAGHDRRYAGEAERLRNPDRLKLLEVERVVDLCLEGITAGTMLDVGTGTGVWAEAFDRRGLRASGVDVNDAMLEAARKLVPRAEFRNATMESLPFPDGAFDLVFLGHVLHEADDMVAALREARRTARQRVAAIEWPHLREDRGPPLEHRLTAERVEELARAAGFAGVDALALSHMVLYRFR